MSDIADRGQLKLSLRDLAWAGSLLVSIAVSWGSMESKMDALETEVQRLDARAQENAAAVTTISRLDATLRSVDARLGRIETHIDRGRLVP